MKALPVLIFGSFLALLIGKLGGIGSLGSWSWWWVTCPIWGSTALYYFAMGVLMVFGGAFSKKSP